MVKYKTIIQIINDYCEKTHLTIQQNKQRLQNWTIAQKKTLLKYGVPNYDEKEYDNILKNGTEEKIWEYERQIIDNLTKGRQDNIIKYLTDFNEKEYIKDTDDGYPSDYKGDIELKQDDIQEFNGYSDEITEAITFGWCGGGYDLINNYILNKGTSQADKIPNHYQHYGEDIINYIENSDGLHKDTIMFRSGHWDIGTKIGDIKETPCLTSLTYWESCAESMNESQKRTSKTPYMITVYAPKNTKGINCNAPSLAEKYPEHEYLIGANQKYIVLNVNDVNHTATIKLVND